jgi:uncharacterized protein Yka (UPF0111/DUF47 family)
MEADMKAAVLAAIGETELSRPAAVNSALAANDRVKYWLSLMQLAAAHADQPSQPAATMQHERLACDIDDAALDGFTAAARREGSTYLLPHVDTILSRIADDLRAMAAPVLDKPFGLRLQAVLAALPSATDNVLDAADLAAMTTANPPRGGDSLHRLVMDLHRRLNAAQAALAKESIDGAAAYDLIDADRERVAAFMAGLNRTAALKFNHPGLATTATRCGGRLVIQNDIGETEAHVVVIHIESLSVTVTYTDVHQERLRFFQDLLARSAPSWETMQPSQLDGGAAFYLTKGQMQSDAEAALRDCLRWLGSRLVFLIDWNRARKQLRGFLPNNARVALLRWAAEQEVGHRAFLELGGATLVNQAIEATAGSAMHFGDRLCDVLGVAETSVFLRFVLQAATDCLSLHRSPSLLRDRIRAELTRHFRNERRRLLVLAADHASLLFELATLAREGVMVLGEAPNERLLERARALEHDADRVVADVYETIGRRPDYTMFGPLLHTADDAADGLEEAVFLLHLLTETRTARAAEPLQLLASLLVEASQEWLKALLHAAHAEDRHAAEDADDFLVAIDRVAELEHAADDAERALTASAVRQATDFRQLHLLTALGDRLEEAADALKKASMLLRNHLLGEVLDA